VSFRRAFREQDWVRLLAAAEVPLETATVWLAWADVVFSRVQSTYLDAAAFTRAPEAPNGTSLADQDFGNSGVGIVRGPGQHNLDMAIERLFPIKRGSNFLFRAEAFNLTNTPQFANPNTSLGYADATQVNPVASSTFGKITSTVTNPRIPIGGEVSVLAREDGAVRSNLCTDPVISTAKGDDDNSRNQRGVRGVATRGFIKARS
jgi:hypothetical protein